MSKKIIMDISFNVKKFKEERLSKEWIDQRISIFMHYTLKSLKKQSNQEFLAPVQYDPFTEDLIKKALTTYDSLPANIQYVTPGEYYELILDGIKGYDYLYLVRLDCDDMYHQSFIQQLHDYKPKANTRVLINQRGYMYDSVHNRIVEIFNPSPPFYTLIYNTEDYVKGIRYKLPGGHGGAIKLPHEIIDKNNYVIHVHSNNTLNKFRPHKFMVGDIISDDNKVKEIIQKFM